jgi:hypothetical protein
VGPGTAREVRSAGTWSSSCIRWTSPDARVRPASRQPSRSCIRCRRRRVERPADVRRRVERPAVRPTVRVARHQVTIGPQRIYARDIYSSRANIRQRHCLDRLDTWRPLERDGAPERHA